MASSETEEPAAKTPCESCGTEILATTAAANARKCRKCRPTGKVDHESIAANLTLLGRFIFATVFGCVFAGLGYGLGATAFTGLGWLLAIVGFPIGGVYGFFCVEINRFIRWWARGLLTGD